MLYWGVGVTMRGAHTLLGGAGAGAGAPPPPPPANIDAQNQTQRLVVQLPLSSKQPFASAPSPPSLVELTTSSNLLALRSTRAGAEGRSRAADSKTVEAGQTDRSVKPP